ncbi:MAG: ABC transporter ATP-binding protein [Clostridia bacterium]|nr:ABC transporter ATP-binding protein [Clostridia bacterium]
MTQNGENKTALPRGFETGRATQEVSYAKKDAAPQKTNTVDLRGRPGGGRGGPGARMAAAVEKPKDLKKTLRRLLRYFGRESGLILLLFFSVIAVTVTALIAPSLQGSAIDRISEKSFDSLPRTLILLAAVYGVRVLFTLSQTLTAAHLSQRTVKRMRHDLFEKIDRLPIAYLDTHSNGDVMSRMTNDVENVSDTVSQSLGSLVSGVLTVVGTIAVMLWHCWQLTLISLVTVVLTVLVTKKLSGVMRKLYRRRSSALGALNGHAEEMITGFRSTVAYNKEDDVIAEFNAASDELRTVGIKADILGGSMGPVMNCISNIGFVIVAAFGGLFALKGMITIGTISAFIIYAKQFSRPINEIAQLYGSVQTAIAGAERVFELMDQPDEDNRGEKPMEKIRGDIRFEKVNFSYIPGKQVLFDFDLDVRPGEKIALVGATGSGKTTVVNLLMRFYPPDSGHIYIDGVDIYDYTRDSLRKNTAIVLQDTVLFSDTVEQNIRYANTEASEEEMRRAAEASNSAYFIERLPEQYATYLKHAGASLSQGERQLLAIARAILADPKILILDEATSSVDTRTEKRIQDAMVRLMANRTSLIIAHRLSTVRDADKIVVMDHGRVTETGNHEELLEKKGKYYELYMTQFAGNQI